jgi:hypothetical protein
MPRSSGTAPLDDITVKAVRAASLTSGMIFLNATICLHLLINQRFLSKGIVPNSPGRYNSYLRKT